MSETKTDCQGEDPIMILIERLRNSARLSTSSDALNPVKLPIEKNLYWKAAEAIASLQGEVERHTQDKRDAYEAVKEALSLCQHTPDEWLAMPPELAAFKREMFGVLEMRCLNLGYGVRAALSQHPGEGEKA